ncbi:hypothetical protein CI109_101497 [Kwoniella shandongensis]|uniref:Uncharacterized protein n=1 Tax=Kwoniella shandongensis TaxID=1734106 RepID=A0A5M6C2Y7_9TREE|nr:uncharacterized protein CI109_001911 [Kwoniella shandongensis]KAA5529486.1 hypothetical protein CI109_001911 [Kwoniella shandongensis]
MAAPGTQSPSSEKPDPTLPEGAKQLTQAEQRPDSKGNTSAAPGEGNTAGVTADAIKVAQESAKNVEGESRHEVETGTKSEAKTG